MTEYLKHELAKVIFPSDGVKGETLDCEVNEKPCDDEPDPPQRMQCRIGAYPFDENDEDNNYSDAETPEELARMCDPNSEEYDFYIVAIHGKQAHWEADGEPIDSDGHASLVYHENGFATLTITDRYLRQVFSGDFDAEDCQDLWIEFDYDGTHYKANLFDNIDDYGVGCWVYPNGDETAEEIPLELEVYKEKNLLRTSR